MVKVLVNVATYVIKILVRYVCGALVRSKLLFTPHQCSVILCVHLLV